MEYFETIVKTLLENEGYWVRQSYKVNLTKDEKKQIGKLSIPRPEIDIIAYKPVIKELLVLEVKSFFDSTGVRIEEIIEEFEKPEGRYKLFTCKNYRDIILNRLRQDLESMGMIDGNTRIKLGLVAGNVYKNKSEEIKNYFNEKGWFFWSPEEVRDRVIKLAKKGYENEPATITAKILMKKIAKTSLKRNS